MSEDQNPYEPPQTVSEPLKQRGSRFFYIPVGIAGLFGGFGVLAAGGGFTTAATVIYRYAPGPRASPERFRKFWISMAELGVTSIIFGLAGILLLWSIPIWIRGAWRRAFAFSAVGFAFLILAFASMAFVPN